MPPFAAMTWWRQDTDNPLHPTPTRGKGWGGGGCPPFGCPKAAIWVWGVWNRIKSMQLVVIMTIAFIASSEEFPGQKKKKICPVKRSEELTSSMLLISGELLQMIPGLQEDRYL